MIVTFDSASIANWRDGAPHQPPQAWSSATGNITLFGANGVGNTGMFLYMGSLAVGDVIRMWVAPVGNAVTLEFGACQKDNSGTIGVTETVVVAASAANEGQTVEHTVVAGDLVNPANAFPGFVVSAFAVNASSVVLYSAQPPLVVNANCDVFPRFKTLAVLRADMFVRLGYGANTVSPPGMDSLLNSFLIDAQEQLYHRLDLRVRERWFTWQLRPNVRFYPLSGNTEAAACTKLLQAGRIRSAWISQQGGAWQPIRRGIDPADFSDDVSGIPRRYDLRQALEVWPAPADDRWSLRIKGEFGLMPFAADTDVATVNDRALFLMALANAKAHYGQPDATNYVSQLEVFLSDDSAEDGADERFIPGERPREVYVQPVPTEPFP